VVGACRGVDGAIRPAIALPATLTSATCTSRGNSANDARWPPWPPWPPLSPNLEKSEARGGGDDNQPTTLASLEIFFWRLARGGGHGGHGGHEPKVTLGAVARHPGADVGYLGRFVGFVHDWWPPPSPPRDHPPSPSPPLPAPPAATTLAEPKVAARARESCAAPGLGLGLGLRAQGLGLRA